MDYEKLYTNSLEELSTLKEKHMQLQEEHGRMSPYCKMLSDAMAVKDEEIKKLKAEKMHLEKEVASLTDFSSFTECPPVKRRKKSTNAKSPDVDQSKSPKGSMTKEKAQPKQANVIIKQEKPDYAEVVVKQEHFEYMQEQSFHYEKQLNTFRNSNMEKELRITELTRNMDDLRDKAAENAAKLKLKYKKTEQRGKKYLREIDALKKENQEKDLRILELTNDIQQLQREHTAVIDKWQFLEEIQEELQKTDAESMSKTCEIAELKSKVKELENMIGCEKKTIGRYTFPAITELFTSHPDPECSSAAVTAFVTSYVNDVYNKSPSSLIKDYEKSDNESSASDSDEIPSCKLQASNEKEVDSLKPPRSICSPLGVSETQIDGQLESPDVRETSLHSMTFSEPMSSKPEDFKGVGLTSQMESFGGRDTFPAVYVTGSETCIVSEVYKENEKLSKFNNVGPDLTELDNSVSSPVQKSDISSYSHFEEIEIEPGGQPVLETTMHESNSDIMQNEVSDMVTVEDISEVKTNDPGMFTEKLHFNGIVSEELVFNSIKNVRTKRDLNGEDCATKLSETPKSPALQDDQVKDGDDPVSPNVEKKLAPTVERHLNIVSESTPDSNDLETEDCNVPRFCCGARISKEQKPKSKHTTKTAPRFKDSSISDTSELDDSKPASDCLQKDKDFLSTKKLKSITLSSISTKLEPQEHTSDIQDVNKNTLNVSCDVQNENVVGDSRPRKRSRPDKILKESESLESLASECSQQDNLLPTERNKSIALDSVKAELEPREYTSDIQNVNKNTSNIPCDVKNENVLNRSQPGNPVIVNVKPEMRSHPDKILKESESLESMASECSQQDNLLPTERNKSIAVDGVKADLESREYISNIQDVNANIPCHVENENVPDSRQRLRSHCDKISKRPESKAGGVSKFSAERNCSPPPPSPRPNFSPDPDFQQRILSKAALARAVKSKKHQKAKKSLHLTKSKLGNVKPQIRSHPDKILKESESLESMASECSQQDNLLPTERNKSIAVDGVKAELKPREYISDVQNVNIDISNIPCDVKNENVLDRSQSRKPLIEDLRTRMRSHSDKILKESESLESMASECSQQDNLLPTERNKSIAVDGVKAELEPQEYTSNILDVNANIPCHVENENVLDSRQRLRSHCDKISKRAESKAGVFSKFSAERNCSPLPRSPRPNFSPDPDFQQRLLSKAALVKSQKQQKAKKSVHPTKSKLGNIKPQMGSHTDKILKESESLKSTASECSQQDNLLPTKRNKSNAVDSVKAELEPREDTSNIQDVNANIPCHVENENVLNSRQRLRSYCDKISERPESKAGGVPKFFAERNCPPSPQPNFSPDPDSQQWILARAALAKVKSQKQQKAKKSMSLHLTKSELGNVPDNSLKRKHSLQGPNFSFDLKQPVLTKLAKNKKQVKAEKLNTSQLVKQSKIPLVPQSRFPRVPQMPIKINEGPSSAHQLKVALHQLDRLKFDNSVHAYNQFKHCFINSLKNPAIVQTCEEIVQITCEHLISSTRDPFSSYIKTVNDVEVLLPRIERCMIDSFCELGHKSNVRFQSILNLFLVTISNLILEKNLPLCGVTALCRTYGGICQFKGDVEMAWGLVYLLQRQKPNLFPFCASSILSVWPHAWSDKKQSGMGAPQKFVLKSMLELPNCPKEMRNSWTNCKKAIMKLYEQDIADIEHVTFVDLIHEFQMSKEFPMIKNSTVPVVEMFRYAATEYGVTSIYNQYRVSEAEQAPSQNRLQNDVPKK